MRLLDKNGTLILSPLKSGGPRNSRSGPIPWDLLWNARILPDLCKFQGKIPGGASANLANPTPRGGDVQSSFHRKHRRNLVPLWGLETQQLGRTGGWSGTFPYRGGGGYPPPLKAQGSLQLGLWGRMCKTRLEAFGHNFANFVKGC